jgi:hypothetical protein
LELAGVLTIILKNRERWLFNDYSAFPIFYILVCIFFAFYLPSFHNAKREHNRLQRWCRWHISHYDYYDNHHSEIHFVERVRRGEWLDPWWSFMSRVCIALIPFFLLFVFFFDLGPKAASFGFAMLIYSLSGWLYLVLAPADWKEQEKELRQKRQKELEEQQKREELGKWK